jgi:hypothetical protein
LEVGARLKLSKGPSDIQNIDDWFKFAPPKKGALQWKDGRSAKELAKAWCAKANGPTPPEEFLKLLAPIVGADHLADADGWPEHQVPIDNLPGEPPNIDLAIVSDGKQRRTAICIEAKADEPFGRYVAEMYDAATKLIKMGGKTRVLERIVYLENNLLPKITTILPGREEIRYQLLTGTAAALAMATKCKLPIAVFVIHEFLFAGHVNEEKVKQNAHDLDHYVTRLTGGAITSVMEGFLLGPLSLPSPKSIWGGVSLYLGKVVTHGAAQ